MENQKDVQDWPEVYEEIARSDKHLTSRQKPSLIVAECIYSPSLRESLRESGSNVSRVFVLLSVMIIIIRLSRQFFAVAIVVVVVAVVATDFFFLIELRRFRPCKINRVRFRAGDLGHAPPSPEDPYREKEEEVFVFFFQGLFLKKRNSTKQLWILFCKGHDPKLSSKKNCLRGLGFGFVPSHTPFFCLHLASSFPSWNLLLFVQ
jgi:hypothetical protein